MLTNTFLYSHMLFDTHPLFFPSAFVFFNHMEYIRGAPKLKTYYNIHISFHMTIECRIISLLLERNSFYIPPPHTVEAEKSYWESDKNRTDEWNYMLQFFRQLEKIWKAYSKLYFPFARTPETKRFPRCSRLLKTIRVAKVDEEISGQYVLFYKSIQGDSITTLFIDVIHFSVPFYSVSATSSQVLIYHCFILSSQESC